MFKILTKFWWKFQAEEISKLFTEMVLVYGLIIIAKNLVISLNIERGSGSVLRKQFNLIFIYQRYHR